MAHRGKLTYFCYKKYCQIIIPIGSWLVCCVVYIKMVLWSKLIPQFLMDCIETLYIRSLWSVLIWTFRHSWWIWYYSRLGQIHTMWSYLPRNVKRKKNLQYERKMIKHAYVTSLHEGLQVYMPQTYVSCSKIQFQVC